MSLEDLRMLDFLSAVVGAVLVIIGTETWMRRRWLPVRIAYALIGLPFLALVAHYINRSTSGATLSFQEVYALHVWTNCSAILTIVCSGIEHFRKVIVERPVKEILERIHPK